MYTDVVELIFRIFSHCLTPEKGVHSFKYFLPQMLTPPNPIVCSCTYAFCVELRLNAYTVSFQYQMHTCMSSQQWVLVHAFGGGSTVYLNECTTFFGVRQCLRLPAMKLREFLSPVAKNLNSIKHFVNLHAQGPLIMDGSLGILINLAFHHNYSLLFQKP